MDSREQNQENGTAKFCTEVQDPEVLAYVRKSHSRSPSHRHRMCAGTDVEMEDFSIKPTLSCRTRLEKSEVSPAALLAGLMWACSFSAVRDSPPVTKLPFSYISSSILPFSSTRQSKRTRAWWASAED